MKNPLRLSTALAATLLLSPAAFAQSAPCGGSFSGFMQNVADEARARNLPTAAINAVISSARQDDRVLRFDRSQGVFRQSFLEFSQRSISSYRISKGAEFMRDYRSILDRARQQYGVPPEVILAFMALETDYGAVQGDFHTISALATLAHDCRRPDLFRPHLFGAIALVARGDMSVDTTGAWAGEIGMVQMMPADILELGVDADGDGRVSLKTSIPDAIMTGARLLASHGWRPNQPWLQEVDVAANFPWERSGLDQSLRVSELARLGVTARQGSLASGNTEASLLLPQGRNGPRFLAYPNYSVYREWNKSFIYAVTAAYLATRLGGANRYNEGSPAPGLSDDEMMALQRVLQARGHDVGGVDGVLGAMTRAAVQAEQRRLGVPADAWPTPELLRALR
ncbi:MAG: lytic murein transglycosylase [Paracoccaceae bacterium]